MAPRKMAAVGVSPASPRMGESFSLEATGLPRGAALRIVVDYDGSPAERPEYDVEATPDGALELHWNHPLAEGKARARIVDVRANEVVGDASFEVRAARAAKD